MVFQDRTLTCVECGSDFTFSVDDQQYHQERGFTNEPRRCTTCRAARRASRQSGGYSDSGPREMYPAVCAECGKDTEVPFLPKGDRPVYCNDCFRQRRDVGGAARY